MKSKFLIFGILVLAIAGVVFVSGWIQPAKPTLLKIEANPAKGFHWAYYLYIPGSVWTGEDGETYLLVEPNNSPEPSDDWSYHDNLARETIEFRAKVIAEELKIPILMPTFPRPATPEFSAMGIDNLSYTYSLATHSLTRDTLLTEIEGLERIDLQLIVVIDDARERLAIEGINVDDKVLMMGFSSSGQFTNRFTLLHPDRIRAAAIGAPGGWLALPLKEWNEVKLRYPVGVWDLESLVGKEFDFESFRKIPLYIFMGDQDINDAVPMVDSYDPEDAQLILQNFGDSIMERWQFMENMYESAGSKARFVLYPRVGHEMTDEMLNDVKTFFLKQTGRL